MRVGPPAPHNHWLTTRPLRLTPLPLPPPGVLLPGAPCQDLYARRLHSHDKRHHHGNSQGGGSRQLLPAGRCDCHSQPEPSCHCRHVTLLQGGPWGHFSGGRIQSGAVACSERRKVSDHAVIGQATWWGGWRRLAGATLKGGSCNPPPGSRSCGWAALGVEDRPSPFCVELAIICPSPSRKLHAIQMWAMRCGTEPCALARSVLAAI